MWWHRERRCRTSNPGISCCLREDERRLAWKPTCVSCCLEKKTRKRASVSRLYTSRTSKYVCHVFPHKDKKVIVNACVLKNVFPHLYTWCSKNLDIRDVFPQKHGNAHVYPHENTKICKGTRLCFQLSSLSCLETRMCETRAFFCVSSRLKSVTVFSRSSSSESLLLPETLHISKSKAKETIFSGKNGTCQKHMTNRGINYKN